MSDAGEPSLADFRRAQRAAWAQGDYRPVAALLEQAAEDLPAAAGVAPGEHVLDVGTGTGNVALGAARVGARVVALDVVDTWLRGAREHAEADGLTVTWILGDAEQLPFSDGSFDHVLSSFAHIFAPRHEATAGELARVCRAGGTVAFTAWIPVGFCRMFEVMGAYAPPRPDFAQPSTRWGEPDHVRGLFGPAFSFAFRRASVPFRFPSRAAFREWGEANSGPVIALKEHLVATGRWDEASGALDAFLDEVNQATDGSFHVDAAYLLAVGRKAA